MAVAWIGSRETLVERAAAHAGALLGSSRCPVFSFDTDIHGTRAAIALAERIGAAYDHAEGAALRQRVGLRVPPVGTEATRSLAPDASPGARGSPRL